jgi:hypothetical protein
MWGRDNFSSLRYCIDDTLPASSDHFALCVSLSLSLHNTHVLISRISAGNLRHSAKNKERHTVWAHSAANIVFASKKKVMVKTREWVRAQKWALSKYTNCKYAHEQLPLFIYTRYDWLLDSFSPLSSSVVNSSSGSSANNICLMHTFIIYLLFAALGASRSYLTPRLVLTKEFTLLPPLLPRLSMGFFV